MRTLAALLFVLLGCAGNHVQVQRERRTNDDDLFAQGRRVFRHDTFGSERYWGGRLRLHEAIMGAENGGVGPGLTPNQALALGLKVDHGALPRATVEMLREGNVSLNQVDTTLALLRADAVIGVKGFFEDRRLVSVGITCALCHSTVQSTVLRGIGAPRDGWPNRDLDVGRIILLAPNLAPLAQEVGMEEGELRRTLAAWGPGRYDAELNVDGRGFRPDGRTAATLLPAAYGLAGVNLHTYTGWGSVTYWNAYVAVTQMHGQGTLFDPRLDDAQRFPAAARNRFGHVRPDRDLVTSRLAALHYYQLGLTAPTPERDTYDQAAARRGEALFNGPARCASCHVPPLFTEPGWSLHTPEEIGIDDFHASRSPTGRYRTTPLRGLFARMQGGFYHDGRFPRLEDVVAHYDQHFRLALSPDQQRDLVEYLKSL